MNYFRSKEDRTLRLERLLQNMLSTMDDERNRTQHKANRNKVIKKRIKTELSNMGLKFDNNTRTIVPLGEPKQRNEDKHLYSIAQDEYIRCKSLFLIAQANFLKAKENLQDKRRIFLEKKRS